MFRRGTRNSFVERASPLTEDIQRILEGCEREFHKEYSVAGDDGSMWFLVHAVRLDLPGTNRFRVLVTREDVTRHRQAEEALRNLGGRLINAQEEERSRVARELHDDLNQRLAMMAIELEQLGQRIPDDGQDLKAPSLTVGFLPSGVRLPRANASKHTRLALRCYGLEDDPSCCTCERQPFAARGSV
jgi:hypothetical protein